MKNVIRDTIPIMTGYIALGMGFGILMDAHGFPIWLSVFMSVTMFAGAMQYAAVGLLAAGASLPAVALTTLGVNARHIFYGISLIDKYKGAGPKKLYMIFGLTDETYSLVSTREASSSYYFRVTLLNHCYWITGSFLGAFLGSQMNFNTEGVDFVLTALFISIFVDQWLNSESHFAALVGLGGSLLCLIIFGPDNFLIPAMVLIAIVLLLQMRGEKLNGSV